ncbi:MAG: membrane protease subunit [Nanoarchaeota archaeon]|nr:membrane protease subunit [Nanoarchaeota archaeon]
MSKEIKAIVIITVIVAVFLTALLVGVPQYRVWQKGLAGKAQLAEAEWNRQIAITEALAKKEAAIALADAEIERARGVAEANKIIGESLKNNDAYLRYLWVQGLQDGTSEVIYVPTEANLPILEATRNM